VITDDNNRWTISWITISKNSFIPFIDPISLIIETVPLFQFQRINTRSVCVCVCVCVCEKKDNESKPKRNYFEKRTPNQSHLNEILE
jgi:hypothetical protein